MRSLNDLTGEEEDGAEYNEGYNDCLSDVRKIIANRIEEFKSRNEKGIMGEIKDNNIRIKELEELNGDD